MLESATEYSLPGSHFAHVLTLAQRWNVSESELFAGLPFGSKELAEPGMAIPVPTAVVILERARTLTREPGIGIYLGLQHYPNEHGFLGFAATSAGKLRDGLDLVVRYASIRTTAFAFSLRVEGGRAAFEVAERADFGSARDIVLLSLLIGMRHMAVAHLGKASDATVVNLTVPEPEYYERFRHLKPRVRFGRKANEIVFDAAILDAPLATADPVSLRLAQEQCERVFESLAGRSRVVDQVARLVLRSDGRQRSCDEVAALLRLSPRTLRRRLADEGTTFVDVRDGELRDRSIVLLRSKDLSLSQIASRLGYANGANFLRAFRKWTGHPPTHYRPDSQEG